MVEPLPRPGAGAPRAKRLFPDLAGAVEIAWTAPHRETLAEHGPRHRRQLAIIRGLCETESLFRRGNRLVGVLGPLRSPRVAEERFDPLATCQTRQQLAQVADGSRIVRQLRSRQATGKLDSRSLLVVNCERKRRVEQRHRIVQSPALERVLCRQHQILDRLARFAGLSPVVGKDRRQVDRLAGDRFDVLSNQAMTLAPGGARKRRVRDIMDEDVLELVLDVAFDPARRHAADEVARLKHRQVVIKARVDTESVEDATPESTPHHRRIQEHLATGAR